MLTMSNDFKGDPREFAVVIPVPTVLQKDQIHVGDKALLDYLDAYSAPRLVEYFDQDRALGWPTSGIWPRLLQRLVSARARTSAARPRALASPSKRRTPSANTIFSFCRRCRATDWKRGCARTVTGFRQAPRGAEQLHQAEPEVLRREGQSTGADEAGLLHAAADSGRGPVAEIHAADSARHGQRRRTAGAVHLRAHIERTRRSDELPDGEAAHRHGPTNLREGSVPRFLPGDVLSIRSRRRT